MQDMADSRPYNTIIYLPLHFDRSTDYGAGRTTDLNLRFKRSLLIKGIFSEYRIPYVEYDFKFSDPVEKVIKDLNLEKFRKR